MKKSLVIIFSLCALLQSILAAPVSIDKAKAVAERLLNEELSAPAVSSQLAVRKLSAQKESSDFFYIFTTSDTASSVIIAADDCAYPVLAYVKHTGEQHLTMPANLKNWLEGYSRQIQFARENGVEPTPEVAKAWKMAASSDYEGEIVVAPLIKTQWDQLSPYNQLIPGSYPTGCVATAMAQIMRYWKYPRRGVGQRSYVANNTTFSADFEKITYNWGLMPNKISAASSAVQKTSIATIMYHCGVASRMTYGSDGSGTYLIEMFSERGDDCAEYAFKQYFGYKESMQGLMRDYKSRNSRYSTQEWTDMVKAELDSGRPLLYSGYGESEEAYAGHAFICDGYTDENYFHFNWGWSGAYDGWFRLNALELDGVGTGGGSGHFNYYQHAIFGLEPDDEKSTPGTPEDTTKVVVALENLKEADILIYPNPASSVLNIQTNQTGSHEFLLRDLSGREVFRCREEKTNNPSVINLNAINEGLYMLTVKTSQSKTTKKVLIAR